MYVFFIDNEISGDCTFFLRVNHEVVGSSRLQHYTAPELFVQWLNPVSTKHTKREAQELLGRVVVSD